MIIYDHEYMFKEILAEMMEFVMHETRHTSYAQYGQLNLFKKIFLEYDRTLRGNKAPFGVKLDYAEDAAYLITVYDFAVN